MSEVILLFPIDKLPVNARVAFTQIYHASLFGPGAPVSPGVWFGVWFIVPGYLGYPVSPADRL
jgi:hypothetical protein